ncbi:PREDICTED: G-protein coupled receptor 39-like [Priapulus caudatus]|uniref:G-protein coupled receptor 39-like n=1 Tax=Priapulus caudatus TaxID=37621 RepID=A0ABM1E8Y8_PRICU|nr:PREDICTED: G-protein coupled receptor 39-like [Priapulus caudatus]
MYWKYRVAVVIAFFICYAPNQSQRLMVVYVQDWNEKLVGIFHIITYVSGVLYYTSATINPILYNVMSLKFRGAFKTTLFRCFRPPKKQRSPFLAHFNGSYKFTSKQVHSDTSGTQMECPQGANSASPDSRAPLRPRGASEKMDNHTRAKLVAGLPLRSRSPSPVQPPDRLNHNELRTPSDDDPFEDNIELSEYMVELNAYCLNDAKLNKTLVNGSRKDRLNNYSPTIINDLMK